MAKIFLSANEEDIILPDTVQKEFPGTEIIYFHSTGSTQEKAKDILGPNGGRDLLVLAEEQTGGMGRFGREWVSPQGGLWFSLALSPEIEPGKSMQLGLIVSVSLCRTLEKYFRMKPVLKWPNDIMLRGKKLAGILVNTSISGKEIKRAVLGVGININNILPDKLAGEAVSLRELTGKKINRTNFLVHLIRNILADYEIFKVKGFKHFYRYYLNRSLLRKKTVEIFDGRRKISGFALGVDKEGFLLLKTKTALEKITGGTVLSYE